MNTQIKNFLTDALIALIGMLLILLGQLVGKGINPFTAINGAVICYIATLFIIGYKALFPKSKFPTFALALLIGVILSIPLNPLSGFILKNTSNIDFLATTTPILAFAGLSMGNNLSKLKALGWKLIIVAIVVFITTYLLSAVIAQIYLKSTGVI